MPTPKQGYTNAAGVPIPGCTTVLGALAGAPNDALLYWAAKLAKQGLDWKSERQRSADVGSFCHDALENFPAPLPPRPLWMTNEEWDRCVAVYSHYAEWEAAVRPEIVAHEVQLVSEELQCGGTFDALMKIGGEVVVVDHKTGKSIDLPKVCAQIAMYAHAALETGLVKEPIRRGLILHYPEKKFRPIEVNPQQMAAGGVLFRTAREAYRLFKEFPR